MSQFSSPFGIFPGRRRPTVYAGSAPYTGDSAAIAAMTPRAPSATPNYPPAPFIDQSGSRPTIGSMPMSPYGGNSSYADSHSAPWMASLERNRQQADAATGTAKAFAFNKRSGQNDAQARGGAYLADGQSLARGGPMVQGPYGVPMAAPPTIVAPTVTSSRGAGAGAPPIVAPYGANVVTPTAPAGRGAAPNAYSGAMRTPDTKDYTALLRTYTDQEKQGIIPSGSAATRAKEDWDHFQKMGGAPTSQPTTQPSAGGGAVAAESPTQQAPAQPQMPTTPQDAAGFPATGKQGIPISGQSALVMWDVLRKQYPDADPGQVSQLLGSKLTQEYGIPVDHVTSWMNGQHATERKPAPPGGPAQALTRVGPQKSQPAAPPAQAQPPQQQQAGAAMIRGDDEYASLPSGAEFVGPDGVHRRKP